MSTFTFSRHALSCSWDMVITPVQWSQPRLTATALTVDKSLQSSKGTPHRRFAAGQQPCGAIGRVQWSEKQFHSINFNIYHRVLVNNANRQYTFHFIILSNISRLLFGTDGLYPAYFQGVISNLETHRVITSSAVKVHS